MTSKITFLHTADIHFGAPMRGFRDLSDIWKARLREAIPQAFDRVIDAALSHEVDFVVLAGDAFDTSEACYGDYLHFFEGLHRLYEANIPIYLVPGNHDPFTSWTHDIDRLPPNAHMLGGETPEFALFEREGSPLCLIGARGYRNQAWPVDDDISQGITRENAVSALRLDNPRAAEAPFCIGVIHAGLVRDQSKAFCDSQALLAADVDLWACGHLHEKHVIPLHDNPKVVFPGGVQGRDLKESGDRGCFLVTMERDEQNGPLHRDVRVSLTPVSTASIVFHTLSVDVGACQTLADIAHLAQGNLFHENAKASCDDMIVRIVLTGTTDLHSYLSQQSVLEDLRKRVNNAYPTFYCDALVDCTKPPRNRASTMREGLFEAQVLRVADQQRALPREMVNFVQAEFVKRGIDVPSSLVRRIAEFNDEAETLVLDLLEENDR